MNNFSKVLTQGGILISTKVCTECSMYLVVTHSRFQCFLGTPASQTMFFFGPPKTVHCSNEHYTKDEISQKTAQIERVMLVCHFWSWKEFYAAIRYTILF